MRKTNISNAALKIFGAYVKLLKKTKRRGKMETVRVADIAEYNYQLGTKCCLLEKNGLNPYINTEEEVCAFLEASAKDKESVEFCKTQARCSGFWKEYEQGRTPFNESDPIRLVEENGYLYIAEGKHRCCLAMRSGIEHIQAQVSSLDESEYSLLPEVGSAGQFTFTAAFGKKQQAGEIAVLWIAPPKGEEITKFMFRPIPLNVPFIDCPEERTVLDGISYKLTYETKCHAPQWEKLVTATVDISPTHRNTRVWLFTIPAEEIKNKAAPINMGKTYYRRGRWRSNHMKQAFQIK